MDYQHEKQINELIKSRAKVVMYLTNGFQIHGTVKGYDGKTILFEEETGTENICWTHAVSTIQLRKHASPATQANAAHGRR